MDRPFGVVARLGHGLIGEPVRERLLVGLRDHRDRDIRRRTVGSRDGDRRRICVDDPLRCRHRDPGASGTGMGVEPGADLALAENRTVEVESGLGLRFHRRQRVEQPVAQYPELKFVEERVDAFPVPADECQFVRTGRQLHIADELRQVPIGLYRREIGAQRVAYLALDLVNMVDQLVQRTVLADPLGRGLVADAGHSGQVVAVITAQRGYVRILGRGDAVLGLYLFGSEPGQLRHAALGVENGDRVIDQLQ